MSYAIVGLSCVDDIGNIKTHAIVSGVLYCQNIASMVTLFVVDRSDAIDLLEYGYASVVLVANMVKYNTYSELMEEYDPDDYIIITISHGTAIVAENENGINNTLKRQK